MATAHLPRTDAQFRETLLREYRIIEMDGDGNCFFSAIAASLPHLVENQRECREAIWNYVDANFDEIAAFVDLDDQNLRDELETILDDGHWGGDLAIHGACNTFHCNIYILQPNAPTLTYRPTNPVNPDNPRDIYLSFHNAVHYNLLIPRPINDEDDDILDEAEIGNEGNSESDKNDDDCSSNEEDDDYRPPSEEFSSETDEDRQDTIGSASTNPILDDRGFPFLAKGFYNKFNDELTLAIMIQKPGLQHRNLLEAIRIEKPKELIMMTLYNLEDVLLLYSDESVKCLYTVYVQKFSLPDDPAMHDRNVWLSQALIIPILLSVIGYTWNNIKIIVMCKMGRIGKPAVLLHNVWSRVRFSMIDDMDYLLANPQALFCEECKPSCPRFKKHWHSDISKYLFQEVSDESAGFLETFRTLDWPSESNIAPVMDGLVAIYNSSGTQQEKWENLKYELHGNATWHLNHFFSTYLILHLDGPEISKYGPKDVYRMLKDQTIKKAVYAGQTRNKYIREGHFNDPSSAVNKVLTKTSRIYFIRKMQFSTLQKAALDEAILIEILKRHLKVIERITGRLPFLLLNKKSESRNVLPLSNAEKELIAGFCASEIPIFRSDPTVVETFNYPRFPGNFEITERVIMHSGAYQFRSFDDENIKKHYAKLIKSFAKQR